MLTIEKSNRRKEFGENISNLVKSRNGIALDKAQGDMRKEMLILQTNMFCAGMGFVIKCKGKGTRIVFKKQTCNKSLFFVLFADFLSDL